MASFMRAMFAALVAIGATAAGAARAESYSIDTVHSSILFRIKHMNTSYTWGRFNQCSGKMNLDDKSPSVDVQIKSESIDTGVAKRDQHLKSPDFLNTKQFPSIAFKSTKISKVDDNSYDLDGTLTLHGVSKPVKVTLKKTGGGTGPTGGRIAGFESSFNIKRSDFGMNFMLEGVGDDVLLMVSLECAVQ